MKEGLVALMVLVALSLEANAQLVEFSDETRFSPETVLLNFDGFGLGVEASVLYTRWGVRFDGPEPPRINSPTLDAGGSFTNWLENGAGAAPLVGSLERPVKRLAFRLHGPFSTVQLKAFDRFGTLLGTVDTTKGFVGLETSSDYGISQLTVDYGDSDQAERIDDLRLDFITAPLFRTYLAQFADVKGLDVIIQLTNPADRNAQARLLFHSSSGEPLAVTLDNTVASDFQVVVPAGATRSLTFAGQSETARKGYAVVESDKPVLASAILSTTVGGSTVETGVLAQAAGVTMSGGVYRDPLTGSDTALAFVNTSTERTGLALGLEDQSGARVKTVHFELSAGEHRAQFIDEIFGAIPNDFKGTVYAGIFGLINSPPGSLVMVVLKTLNGRATASIPVGSLSKD